MLNVIVKYNSEIALKALQEFVKAYDMEIEQSTEEQDPDKKTTDLPITVAKNPDVTALAGYGKAGTLPRKNYEKKLGEAGFELPITT